MAIDDLNAAVNAAVSWMTAHKDESVALATAQKQISDNEVAVEAAANALKAATPA